MPRRPQPELANVYMPPFKWNERHLGRIISIESLLRLLYTYPNEWFAIEVDGKPEVVIETKRIVPTTEIFVNEDGRMIQTEPYRGDSMRYRLTGSDERGYPTDAVIGYGWTGSPMFVEALYEFIQKQMDESRNVMLRYPLYVVPAERLDRLVPPKSAKVMAEAMIRERQSLHIYVDGAEVVDIETMFMSPRRYCFFVESRIVSSFIGISGEARYRMMHVNEPRRAHMDAIVLKEDLIKYLDHVFTTHQLRGSHIGCVMHPAREVG